MSRAIQSWGSAVLHAVGRSAWALGLGLARHGERGALHWRRGVVRAAAPTTCKPPRFASAGVRPALTPAPATHYLKRCGPPFLTFALRRGQWDGHWDDKAVLLHVMPQSQCFHSQPYDLEDGKSFLVPEWSVDYIGRAEHSQVGIVFIAQGPAGHVPKPRPRGAGHGANWHSRMG